MKQSPGSAASSQQVMMTLVGGRDYWGLLEITRDYW